MLLPDDPLRRTRLRAARVVLSLLVIACATAVQADARKVKLVRKYRPGQAIVYITKVSTSSKINSNPAELKNFFPPMPTNLSLDQQCTVTVSGVHPDGAADVQQRFDKFEIQTDSSALPENVRDSIAQAQQEVTQRLVGQTLTVHYDHDGRLVDFDGGDNIFHDISGPVREPFMQMLRLSLEQMGGESLYPDHPVKVGEEWTRNLGAQPVKNYAFQVEGTSTLHYAGKTRYQGVKAAIVDYHFENTLTPAVAGLRKEGALPQLEAMGMRLSIQISGKGQGRVLVALDDGRVLQNHSTLHQTLSAVMKGSEGFAALAGQLPQLEIQSDTEMQVDGSKP
jgi:hypothetical protein